MRKFKNGLASIVVLLILLACRGDYPRSQELSTPEDLLEIVWRKPLVNDILREFTIAMDPVLHKEHVIFGTEAWLDSFRAPVMFMDTANGKIDQYWDDYALPGGNYSDGNTVKIGKYLILKEQLSLDCINLDTKKTQWQQSGMNGSSSVFKHKGYLYTAEQTKDERTEFIIRTKPDQRAWDTVFSFTKTDKFKPNFVGFGFGQLENGDEVMVWKNRNWGAYGFITDIFAYNLSADTLMWRNRDMQVNTGIIPLKVENGVIFGLVQQHAFAMDLASGNMIWFKNVDQMVKPIFPLSFSNGDFHINEQNLVIMGMSDEFFALDKSTGNLLWKETGFTYGPESLFTYFEGKLIFPANGIRIVDAQTGEKLISEAQSHQIKPIHNRIIVDSLRRVMYLHDHREAYCIKIPDGI